MNHEKKINEIFDQILPSYISCIPPISGDSHEMGMRAIEINRLKNEAGNRVLEELKLSGVNPLHPEAGRLMANILDSRFKNIE